MNHPNQENNLKHKILKDNLQVHNRNNKSQIEKLLVNMK